jgi:hypothetical protein
MKSPAGPQWSPRRFTPRKMPIKPSRAAIESVVSVAADLDSLSKDVVAMDVRIKGLRGRMGKGAAQMLLVREIERDWKALSARTETLRASAEELRVKLTSGA